MSNPVKPLMHLLWGTNPAPGSIVTPSDGQRASGFTKDGQGIPQIPPMEWWNWALSILDAWQIWAEGMLDILAGQNLVPTGTIAQFAGAVAPSGWLFCDGSAIARDFYDDLFSVIGESYGAGDGNTTFNLPDARGAVLAGYKSDDTGAVNFSSLGTTVGEKTHALIIAELAEHTHPYVGLTAGTPYIAAGSSGVVQASSTTGSAGSGTAHNNIQPSLVVNHIIKV